MSSINFEQLDNINKNCINWSNKSILDKCKIMTINDNETIENLQILIYKNNLQRKIADDQHTKISDIYSARSKSLAYCHKASHTISKKGSRDIRSVISGSCKLLEKYFDLDMLLVLQKYREGKYIIATKDQILELDFIEHLLLVIKMQRIVIDKQLLKIVSLYQKNIYSVLSERYVVDINDSNMDSILDKKLVSNLKLLNELLKQKRQSICECSYNKSIPDVNIKICKLIKKIATPQVSQNCCICFENIKSKIGLVPCGHTAICEQCAAGINSNKCPICMTPFTQFIKIFD